MSDKERVASCIGFKTNCGIVVSPVYVIEYTNQGG